MNDYEKMRDLIRKEIDKGSPKENEYKYKWRCGVCGNITFSKKPIKECIYKCRQQ